MNRSSLLVAAMVLAATSCSQSKERYLAKGNEYLNAGKYEDAALNYRKALQKDPRFVGALYQLGQTHERQSQYLEAYQVFTQVLALDPNHSPAKTALANLALAAYLVDPIRPAGLYEQVARLSDEFLAKDPNSFEGLRLKGHLAAIDRKPQEAIGLFRRADSVKPGDPQVRFNLANLLRDEGAIAEAERTAVELLAVNPRLPGLHEFVYDLYFRQRKFDDALRLYQQRAEANPTNTDMALMICTHHMRIGKKDERDRCVEDVVAKANQYPLAYLRAGDLYRIQGELETAERYYQQGRRDPQVKVECLKRLAGLRIQQGKRDEAASLLDEALQVRADDAQAQRARAGLDVQRKESASRDRAVAAFRSLVEKTPADAGLRVDYARALLAAGNSDEARRQLLDAAQRDPVAVGPRLALAELSVQAGQFADAQRHSEEVLRLSPNHRQARLIHTGALLGQRQVDAAAAEANELLREDPKDFDARLQAALIQMARNRRAEAESSLSRLMQERPRDPRAAIALAEAAAARQQTDQAIDLLVAAAKTAADPTRVRLILGAVAARGGRHDLAIESLQQALAAEPDSADYHLRLGEALQLKGDVSQAAAMFRKAGELAPKNGYPWASLGNLESAAGRLNEARLHYQRALEREPANPVFMNAVAYLSAELGQDLDKALQLAQEVNRRIPNQPDFEDTLGWLYLKKNQPDSALPIFRKLVEKNPKQPSFRHHLGAALLAKGDRDAARRELSEALKLSPSPEEEQRIRQALANL